MNSIYRYLQYHNSMVLDKKGRYVIARVLHKNAKYVLLDIGYKSVLRVTKSKTACIILIKEIVLKLLVCECYFITVCYIILLSICCINNHQPNFVNCRFKSKDLIITNTLSILLVKHFLANN